ncbi:DMT family transporter [Metasolibacillus meyeri]|uniref:DMT family transporter n=1 Tax=Metasolibacillus meyeri TaxID=1071052 RepID=UPI000D2F6BA8|nr:multidrug efflux SMR transporter [Metasolibacillus meyeri]
MSYLFLLGAIICEVIGSSLLKVTERFSKLIPTIGMLISYGAAFYLLALALHELPLGFSYAIWSGLGTALTAIVGVIIYKEIVNLTKILGLLLIIAGVVVLNIAI